jgi:flagellar motor switch protein FliM
LSAVAIAELALGADENESTESRPLTPLESKLVERLLVRVLERAAQSLQIPGKDPRFFASRTALSRELGTDGDRRRIAIRIPFSIGPARAVIHLLMAA